jgi:hypothetical protein
MGSIDLSRFKYCSLTKPQVLTWMFREWPQGNMVVHLHLSPGLDYEGEPAIALDLSKSQVPTEIQLLPLYFTAHIDTKQRLWISQKNEGLTARLDGGNFLILQPQTFLLFQTHGTVLESLAILEVGPHSSYPGDNIYAGVIPYVPPGDW